MKKVLAIILAMAMILCFASCAAEKKGSNSNSANGDGSEVTLSGDLQAIKDKGVMVIGITEYEPMNYKDSNNNWTGFDTEFAYAVAEKLGVEVEFVEIEWESKIMELDAGSIDCVWNGMTLTDEVKAGMNCTDPYVKNAQVLVMASDKINNYTSVDALGDLVFAAEGGSAGEKAIIEAGYDCTSVLTQADALLEVKSGAADACVIDITMANAMTGEGTSYEDLAYGLEFNTEVYGIGFRKGSDVTAEVNKIIAELKADGTLQALADKYELTLAD